MPAFLWHKTNNIVFYLLNRTRRHWLEVNIFGLRNFVFSCFFIQNKQKGYFAFILAHFVARASVFSHAQSTQILEDKIVFPSLAVTGSPKRP